MQQVVFMVGRVAERVGGSNLLVVSVVVSVIRTVELAQKLDFSGVLANERGYLIRHAFELSRWRGGCCIGGGIVGSGI
jgi:hypothetical protein